MRNKREALDGRDALVDRLREFIRFGYVTGSEVARRIGVHDGTVYSWLLGEFRPAEPARLKAFLDALPAERGSGITPTGYQYREYKNWRGIPKPRRCPFCKRAKGKIRKTRGGFQGVCPNCGASGLSEQVEMRRYVPGMGEIKYLWNRLFKGGAWPPWRRTTPRRLTP